MVAGSCVVTHPAEFDDFTTTQSANQITTYWGQLDQARVPVNVGQAGKNSYGCEKNSSGTFAEQ